ncbi:hypothetical protein GCM10009691_18460 [Brevibacterium picturae]|uniref:Uncharacterized protein n=1 Tax=Brevibacterium picturae TaxID=260553 RepID=A0ABP4MKM8_9MICO
MTDVLIGYSYFFIDFMSHLPQQATLRVSPVPARLVHHLGPLRLPRHTAGTDAKKGDSLSVKLREQLAL